MNVIEKLREATRYVNHLEYLLERDLKREAIDYTRDWYKSQHIDGRQCEIALRDVLLGEREDIKGHETEHICGGCCYHILQYLANCGEDYLNQILGYSWYHQFRVIDKLLDYEELINMEPFAPNMLYNPKFGHSFIISVEKRNELLRKMNGWVNLNYLNKMAISVELKNGNINNINVILVCYSENPNTTQCEKITDKAANVFKNRLEEKANHRPNILTKEAIAYVLNEYVAELMREKSVNSIESIIYDW
jgi:hypothetical protein